MSPAHPARQPQAEFAGETEPAASPGKIILKRGSRVRPIDQHVGDRIRARRIALGLTQQGLSAQVGVTYQQVHKYERGLNRIAAGTLFALAEALGVEVRYFFDGVENVPEMTPTSSRDRMLLELTRNLMDMRSRKHQEAACSLARTLADSEAQLQNSA